MLLHCGRYQISCVQRLFIHQPHATVEFLGQCDRVVVMAAGRIVADCTPSELEDAKQCSPDLQVTKTAAAYRPCHPLSLYSANNPCFCITGNTREHCLRRPRRYRSGLYRRPSAHTGGMCVCVCVSIRWRVARDSLNGVCRSTFFLLECLVEEAQSCLVLHVGSRLPEAAALRRVSGHVTYIRPSHAGFVLV
jgi:hypothetical protein